jgi:hypothetical protein
MKKVLDHTGMARSKRTVLKNLASRAAGKYTQGGRPKNRARPEPSMPKFKCLEETD